ncbi:hypothetical protein [Spirosoma foliorum]|uniref:Uncharacterized protein n=1 Tax=Spirosoma foliorum TaxID=2710596 RepID=A0A7G5GZG4_9BACT|nr:hypothetical protein [Spirosoma foliorum]QMW04256.1 hypothetical protein H3H32_04700 [Spirosoma foliorum]
MAGIYGIVHDQLTYTISPEYYTKFKFYQFGLMDSDDKVLFRNLRIDVAIVGFLATWWMGLLVGLIMGLVGFIHKDAQQMFRITINALFATIFVAFLTSLTGFIYGTLYATDIAVDWWFPDNLTDRKSFILVGIMHDFSYLGGLMGLLAGIFYSLRKKRIQQ